METKIKWFFIGFASVLIYVLLYLLSMFKEPIGFDIYGVIWLGCSLLLIWEVTFYVFNYYHKHNNPASVKSAFLFFITSLPFGILSFDVLYVILRILEPYLLDTPFELEWIHMAVSSSIGAILSVITFSIILLSQTLSRWKNVEINLERLKRQNSEIQLNSLKEQISPHFLFNNLNTLQTLVKEKSEHTLSYIHHLSELYRYILQHQHDELVLVKTEMEFINAYAKLLKERFGKSIIINTAIGDDYLKRSILTLSIYTLIENAIKHNLASIESPLIIQIHSTNNYIEVSNNIQKKESVISNKIGLENLKERYRLLDGSSEAPKIDVSNIEFKVALPVVEVTNYESTNN